MKYEITINERFGYKEIFPKPTREEIDRFYREDFYAEDYKYFNDSSIEVQLKDLTYLKNWWSLELGMLKEQLNKTSMPLSLLDIGCGWCQFLKHAKDGSWEVKGLDPSPEAAVYGASEGLNVHVGGFDDFTAIAEPFSCVILKNVLEHIVSPVDFLQNIADNFLAKNSLIQIEVPNEFSLLQKVAVDRSVGNEWWVAPPAHLNYFDLSSLRRLLNDLGFEIVDAYSSFPMEFFILMGRDYVSNPDLGSNAHLERVTFENSFFDTDRADKLLGLYRSFADAGIGRQISIIGRKLT